MTYLIEVMPSCHEAILKKCRRNPVLEEAVKKKIDEIVENPYHYKPLRYDLAGQRRVHILKNFVLKFDIDENTKTVRFVFFGHHDEAYRR